MVLPRAAYFALLFGFFGCGRIGYDPQNHGASDAGPGVVTALFASAPGFTDYVVRARPEGPVWLEDGTPCDTARMNDPTGCTHAGVLRQAMVPGVTSCAGIDIADSLGALQWACVDGDPVRAISTGFAPGRGARDLLSPTGFRPASVMLFRAGLRVASTAEAVWWSTPVLPLPSAPSAVAVLRAADTVYVAEETQRSFGYNLDADGIAIVSLGAGRLELDPAAAENCSLMTGEPDNMPPYNRCLFAAGNQSRLWIEVNAELSPLTLAETRYISGLQLNNCRLVRIHRSTFTGGAIGINLQTGSAITMSPVQAHDMDRYGILVDKSEGVLIYDSKATNCGNVSPGTAAVGSSATSRLQLVNTFAGDSIPYAFLFALGSGSATATHLTAVGSTFSGMTGQGVPVHVSNSVSLNNGTNGLELRNLNATSGGDVAQLVVLESRYGLRMNANTQTTNIRDLRIGGSSLAPCRLESSPNELLVEQTGDCISKAGPPVALDLPPVGAATVVRGSLGSPMDCGQITDWQQSGFRSWVPDPALAELGRCTPTQQADCRCAPYDWAPVGVDGDLIAGQAAIAGSNQFVPGEVCPPSLQAGGVANGGAAGASYLLNALEMIGDGYGDDDRFCEASERCWLSEDIGAQFEAIDRVTPTGQPCSPAGLAGTTVYRR